MRFTRRQFREQVEKAVRQYEERLVDKDADYEAILRERDRMRKWARRRSFAYGWMAAGLFNWAVYATGLLDAGTELFAEKVAVIRQAWGI